MLELLQQAFEVYKNGGDVALENWYNELPPKKRKQYTHEFSASVIAMKKGLEAAKEYLDKFASAQQKLHPTPESLASSQAVVNADNLSQSDGESQPAQARVS